MRFGTLLIKLAVIVFIVILMNVSLAAEDVPTTDSSTPEPVDTTVDEAEDDPVSLEDRRAAGRERLAQLSDEKRFDEAAAVALQILRLTQEEYGEDAPQVIDPLISLAEVQRKGSELSAAEQNLSVAVKLIERYYGPLSEKLIVPLTLLGEIHNESGLYEKAVRKFDRALRLNHVNHGFTNFDQLPIMDGLTASYSFQNDIDEATFYQKSQLEIQQRRLGIDNPETAPAYYKLARWYSRTNRYDEAILTYQQADRVIREALGDDSPERTEGLSGMALVYQKIGNRSASSSILRTALQLIEESPENDPFRRAKILVALGDNMTREGKFSTAQKQYVTAWQALPDDDKGDESREFYFSNTVRLEGNLFPQYAKRARGQPVGNLKTGSVLIDYSIDTNGRVTDQSVVESEPQGLMDKSFLTIYRRSLFRPIFVDGVPQNREGLLARHEFLYVDEQAPADDGASDDDNTDLDDDDDTGNNGNRGKLSYPDDN